MRVNVNKKTILVFRNTYKHGVVEEWIKFKTPIYKVYYATGEGFYSDVVLARAKIKIKSK